MKKKGAKQKQNVKNENQKRYVAAWARGFIPSKTDGVPPTNRGSSLDVVFERAVFSCQSATDDTFRDGGKCTSVAIGETSGAPSTSDS